jgi:hypothetical protein
MKVCMYVFVYVFGTCVHTYIYMYICTYVYTCACIHVTMPVAERTKTQVCNCLIAGIAGSNPGEGMDFRLLRLLCVLYVMASATG